MANLAARFGRFCPTAGAATLAGMTERDGAEPRGPRYGRHSDRRDHLWGRTAGGLGFRGGRVGIERPRMRARGGARLTLASWVAAQRVEWPRRWVLTLMLVGASARRFGRWPAPARGRRAGTPGQRCVELRCIAPLEPTLVDAAYQAFATVPSHIAASHRYERMFERLKSLGLALRQGGWGPRVRSCVQRTRSQLRMARRRVTAFTGTP